MRSSVVIHEDARNLLTDISLSVASTTGIALSVCAMMLVWAFPNCTIIAMPCQQQMPQSRYRRSFSSRRRHRSSRLARSTSSTESSPYLSQPSISSTESNSTSHLSSTDIAPSFTDPFAPAPFLKTRRSWKKSMRISSNLTRKAVCASKALVSNSSLTFKSFNSALSIRRSRPRRHSI